MTALLVLAALSQRAAAVVPLAHYTFDGQSLASSAGESNTGTNYGATYVTGMDGGDALYFDGGSDFVEFPAAITVTAGENRSVCVWARVHGDYFDGGVLYFSGSLETLGCNEFSLQLKEYAASYWTMLLSRYGTCDKVIQVSGSDDDEWHHYCTTYDGVDWHLYFDGALQSEGPASLDTGTTYPLRLGNRPTEDYGNQYHFTGYVDELYVFDVVLRASDVTSIYNLYTATPTEFPTVQPTSTPTHPPEPEPSHLPTTGDPSAAPSTPPSSAPTACPTTTTPSAQPFAAPSALPTMTPSNRPTSAPTEKPTWGSTSEPTPAPLLGPTSQPTGLPTSPTADPTVWPSATPSPAPTSGPSPIPSTWPSNSPTTWPSPLPSIVPTTWPSTKTPTGRTTAWPSATISTTVPSSMPTSGAPSVGPTALSPTVGSKPSVHPTMKNTLNVVLDSFNGTIIGSIAAGDTVTGDTTLAPTELGNSASDHYFTFQVDAVETTVEFDTCGSNFDTYLRIYKRVPPTTCIAITDDDDYDGVDVDPCMYGFSHVVSCDDCGDCDTETILTHTLEAGSYVLLLEGYSDETGTYTLTMTTFTPSAQPTLTPLPTGAPTEEPTKTPSSLPSVLPTATPVGEPTRVPLSAPSAMPTTAPSSTPTQQPLPLPTTAAPTTPSPTISVRPSIAPTATNTLNDILNKFNGTIVGNIAAGDTVTGDTTPAPTELGNYANDHYYTFDIDALETIEFDTCGSDFDTYLRIYKRVPPTTCSAITDDDDHDGVDVDPCTYGFSHVVSCDDCGDCGVRTILTQTLEVGKYVLLLEGYDDDSGMYTLTMTAFTPTTHPTITTLPTGAPSSEPTPTPYSAPSATPTAMPTSKPTQPPSPLPTTRGPTTPSPTISDVYTLSGTIWLSGLTSTQATDARSVIVNAISTSAGIDASTVSVDITAASDRRRLEDSTLVSVSYTIIASETVIAKADANLGNTVAKDFDAALAKAADDSAVDFSNVVTLSLDTPVRGTLPPSTIPTTSPSSLPSTMPTLLPFATPTISPSSLPSAVPTIPHPTPGPTLLPTEAPTMGPTVVPTSTPSGRPSPMPSSDPTTARPTTPGPTVEDVHTLSGSMSLSGLNASQASSQASVIIEAISSQARVDSSTVSIKIANFTRRRLDDLTSVSVTYTITASASTIAAAQTNLGNTSTTDFDTALVQAAYTVGSNYDFASVTTQSLEAPVRGTLPPSSQPSIQPSAVPSSLPTSSSPSPVPSLSPTSSPTSLPSPNPTSQPSSIPKSAPTCAPSSASSSGPSIDPTSAPVPLLSTLPITGPSEAPSNSPSMLPVTHPTTKPSQVPTVAPFPVSRLASKPPLDSPTSKPIILPASSQPTSPLMTPSVPRTVDVTTAQPSIGETTSSHTPEPTTLVPTSAPSATPGNPTRAPQSTPTSKPTTPSPTRSPTITPCDALSDLLDPPPGVASAVISDAGIEVDVIFDAATDSGGEPIGDATTFLCGLYLDFAGAHASSCYWRQNSQLVVLVDDNVEVGPNDKISVVEGTIKRKCEDAETQRCDCFAYSSNSSAVVSAPANPVVPIPKLAGPSQTAVCEDLEIDAYQSTGSGGKSMTYVWAVTNYMGKNNVVAATVVERTNVGGDSQLMLFNSTELEALVLAGWTNVTVRVTVTNWLLQSATSDAYVVFLSSENVPSIEVVGGGSYSLSASEELAVHAQGSATACDGRDLKERGVDMAWDLAETTSLFRRRLDDGKYDSTSNDPRTFRLPSFALKPGGTYVLTVTATDSKTGVTNSAFTTIYVSQGDLVALIDGSDRAVSTASSVTVSAASSYDEDARGVAGEAAGLLFSWTCETDGGSCDGVDNDALAAAETITVTLNTAGVYVFIVALSDASSSRTATARVELTAEAAERPAVFLDLSQQQQQTVVAHTKTIIAATVTAPASAGGIINSTWSLASGELAGNSPLDLVTTTRVEQKRVRDAGQSFTHNLAIVANALVPGASYTFRLEAVVVGSDKFLPGFASISVMVSRLPSGGRVEVDPASGVALQTRFTLRALNWAADEPPLKYSFSAINEKSATSVLRKPTLDNVLTPVTLEAGNITVEVTAIDAAGSEGTAAVPVAVQPYSSSSSSSSSSDSADDIETLTNNLLDEALALNSYESVCQVVVASARLVTNDTTLLVTLVTALADSRSIEDTDSVSIAQSAAALAAPVATAVEVEVDLDLGLRALNLTLLYALDAATVGLGDSADQTIGNIVGIASNLLGTSLFEDSSSLAIDDTLIAALDALADAHMDKVTIDEVAAGTCSNFVCTAVQRISMDSVDEVTLDNMDAKVQLLPDDVDDVEEIFLNVSLFDFVKDPHGGLVVLGNVVRMIVTSASNERRRLEEAAVRTRLTIPRDNTTALLLGLAGGTTMTVECPRGFVGNATTTCPAGNVVSQECDGTLVVYNVTCAVDSTAACALWNGTQWDEAPHCSLAGATETAWLCDCDLAEDGDYGAIAVETAVASVLEVERSLAVPTQKPVLAPTATPGFPTMTPTEPSCDALRLRRKVPDPPVLAQAYFDTSGAGAVIKFDVQTNQAGMPSGVKFPCADLVDFPSVDEATCSWVESTELYSDVSNALELVPGETVELVEGKLKRECLPGVRCDCLQAASASTFDIEQPDPPLIPKATLEGQTTAAVCEGLRVSSRQSSGGGGRALSYSWDLRLSPPLDKNEINATEAVTAALARAADDLDMTSTELAAVVGAGVEMLYVSVTVRNFLGFEATSSAFPIEPTSETPPRLSIVGGLEQTTKRPATLSVKADAIATPCDSRPVSERGITYIWKLEESTDLVSTSSDPRVFKLPAYTLTPATTYTLAVTATDPGLNISVTTSTKITVQRSRVVAVIAGGASRVVPLNSQVVVSAAQSYDEDTQDASGLSFRWTCVNRATGSTTCEVALLAQLDTDTLTFDGAVLGPGEYVFAVNATSVADSRAGSTSARVSIVDDDPPKVSVAEVDARVSSNARVVAYASVEPSSLGAEIASWRDFTSIWALTETSATLEDGKSLETTARTAVVRSGSPATRQHDLVLPSGSLVAGASYSLELSAVLEGSKTQGYATVAFDVARPPSAGRVAASPPRGVALETRFDITTWNWASEDLPLVYSFKLVAAGVTSTLRGPTRELDLEGSTFPEGDPNVTVKAIAQDTLGGTGEATTSIRTTPTELRGEALSNLTTGLLNDAFALDSSEDVCQAVVASSAAAANDTTLLGTLVSSVSRVVDFQDADEDLVEQSAVALQSPSTSNPAALSSDSAAEALDVSHSLSSTSQDIGVTRTAAESLGSTLSSLLETSLFNDSDKNATAATTFGSAVDGILASQIIDKVAGETASTLNTVNLKTASQRISQNASDQGARSLELPDSDSYAGLPDSINGEDGADFDVSFSQSRINPYGGTPGGDDVTSNVYRFGLSQASSSSRRRRRNRRLDEGNVTTTTAMNSEVVELSIASGVNATSEEQQKELVGTNLTCECEFEGNKSFTCPDGTSISKKCDGMPGVYEVLCPRSKTVCSVWDGKAWSSESCRAIRGASGATTCKCSIPVGESNDYGTQSSLEASTAAYTSALSAVDPSKALFLFISLGALIILCGCLIVLGNKLDARDYHWRRRVAAQPATVTTDVDVQDDHSDEGTYRDDPGSIKSFREALSWHDVGLEHQVAEARAGDDDLNRLDRHPHVPVFFSRSTWRRYSLAVRYEHPFVSWYCVYSDTLPRATRSLLIGFEILMLMFALAVEQLLLYPDPGCSDKLSKADCHLPRAGFWRNHEKLCKWDNCKCELDLPDSSGSTDPLHYALLGVVLVFTLPLIKVFEFLFNTYLSAPPPPVISKYIFRYMPRLFTDSSSPFSLSYWRGRNSRGAPVAAEDEPHRLFKSKASSISPEDDDEAEDPREIAIVFEDERAAAALAEVKLQRKNESLPPLPPAEDEDVPIEPSAEDNKEKPDKTGGADDRFSADMKSGNADAAIGESRDAAAGVVAAEMNPPANEDELDAMQLSEEASPPADVDDDDADVVEEEEEEEEQQLNSDYEGGEAVISVNAEEDAQIEEAALKLAAKVASEERMLFSSSCGERTRASPSGPCELEGSDGRSELPSMFREHDMSTSILGEHMLQVCASESIMDNAKYAAVKSEYASYRRQLDVKLGFFRNSSLSVEQRVSKAVLRVFSKLRKSRELSLQRQSKTLAPVVVELVLLQLRELHELHHHLRQQGHDGKRAARLVKKLTAHVRARWNFATSFNGFVANVERILLRELKTAAKWQEELAALRVDVSDDNEYRQVVVEKLHEYERITRMTRAERLVFDACTERLEFSLDAPTAPPPLGPYVAAYAAVLATTTCMAYVLLAMGTSLGRKQSAVWLINLVISGILTYVIILPIEIFFFYVWVPDLIWDRLMSNIPGKRAKMPYRVQTPYALRFLLESQPHLQMMDADVTRRLVLGDHYDDAWRADNDCHVNELLAKIPAIYHFETWRPSLDTRLVIAIIGLFSSLPDDIQAVVFEEIFSFAPCVSVILASGVIKKFPRRFRSALVLILALLIILFGYASVEVARWLLRRAWVSVKRGSVSKKVRHHFFPFG